MFDSKALGASSQPFLPDSLTSVRNRRDLSQTSIGPQRQHEQNLNLLRQLRGRWTTLVESEQTARLKQEAATYLSRLAPHEHIQGRELRLLQQMTAGNARPTLSDDGLPVEADPKKALKDLDKKIRSLSARSTEGGDPGNPAKVSRAEVQVFGSGQPMKTGTFQGIQSELRTQRDSEAHAETLAQRPEPKTHTVGSRVQGSLSEVVQNRTTLPFEGKEPERKTLVDVPKPAQSKNPVHTEPPPARPQPVPPQPGPERESAQFSPPKPSPRSPEREHSPQRTPEKARPETHLPVDPALVKHPEQRKSEDLSRRPKSVEVRKPEPGPIQPKAVEVKKSEPGPLQPKAVDVKKPEPGPVQPKAVEVRKPEPGLIQPRAVDVKKPEPGPVQPKAVEVRKPEPGPVQPKAVDVRKPEPGPVQPKAVDVRKPEPGPVQPKAVEVKNSEPGPVQPKAVDMRKPEPGPIQPKAVEGKNSEPGPVQPKAVDMKKPEPGLIQPGAVDMRKPEPGPVQPKAVDMKKPEPGPIQPGAVDMRKPETGPVQPKAVDMKKPEPGPIQPGAVEVRKPEPGPVQPKAVDMKKPEPGPIQPGAVDMRKPEPGPVQPKAVDVRKPEPGPVQPKAVEVRKLEPGPIQPKAVDGKNPEPGSIQPKAVEVRKSEPGPIQPRAVDVKKPEPIQPRTVDVKKPEPGLIQPKAADVKKPEPGPIQPKTVDGRKPEPGPSQSQGVEAKPAPGSMPKEVDARKPEPGPETPPPPPRPELQSPLEMAQKKAAEVKAKEARIEEAKVEAAKKELPRAGTPEDVQRLKEEAPPPPLENKSLNALRTLAPLTTVKAATLEKGGEARTKYPEWLQVKLSEDATPAYMTSLPGNQRGPKPVETQPLKVPQQSVDALTKTDYRRTDELRETTSQQQRVVETVSQPAPPATAAKAAQLFQSVVGQGLMASQKPVQDAPKTSEPPRRSVYDEEKDRDKGGIGPVGPGSGSGVPGAGRISGKSEIIETRGLGAVLSGSVGKREGADSGKGSLPNLAAGWGSTPPPDNEARLSNGRTVTAESPIYSPALDELAARLKQGKPLPLVAQEREKPRPLFFDQSEDHHSRLQEEDSKLERLEKSGTLVQAFHQAEASNNTKKREEVSSAQQHAGEKVEDVNDQSNRGRGGSGGGQQREREQQGGQGAQHVQDQQQFQAQRRTQSDTKIELQRLEAYRIAKTDEALKLGLRLSNQPEGKHLAELMNRHAGHSMESLLKKAYRLDSLGELSRDDAVNALGLVLKMGGEFTFAHSARVLELAMDLADEVGVSDKKTRSQVQLGALLKDTGEMALMLDEAPPGKLEKMSDWLGSQDLRQAGLLHDIGKTRVPPEILYKPGKLTEEEYEIMKLHPIIGEQMVYPIESLRHLCPVIRGHHEKWDGSGYPDGLKGEDIPYAARIIAIADVFDALHAERPYKAGMPVERVQAILREGRGTHFDPDLLDAFERVIQRRHPELSNPFA